MDDKPLFFRGSPESIENQTGPFLGECTGVPQPGIPLVEYDDETFWHWEEVSCPPPLHQQVWGVCREAGKAERKVALVVLDMGWSHATWWHYAWDTQDKRPVEVYWWTPIVAPKLPGDLSS